MSNLSLRYCLKEIWGRKNRSMLMLGGIALGVIFWLCLNALAGAYDQAAIAPLEAIGADLAVQKSGGPIPNKFEGAVLPCADDVIRGTNVSKIKAIPGVKQVSPALLLWVFGADQKNSGDFKMVLGIDAKTDFAQKKLKSGLNAGVFLQPGDQDQALVDESYAQTKKIKVGDSLEIAGSNFQVVGVVSTPATNLLGATNIYIPLTKAQRIASATPLIPDFQKNDVNLLFINADPTRVAQIQAEIVKVVPGSNVSTQSRFLTLMGGLAAAAKHLAWLGSLIGILIAVAIVVRTSASGIWERRREIAVMKAVGWKVSDVRRQILSENLLTGISGGIVGLIVSLLFIWALRGQTVAIPLPWELNPFPHFYLNNSVAKVLKVPLNIHLSWGLVVLALVLGVCLALVTTMMIIGSLNKIKPAEVLRNE
ncbi:MAG TPA: ABC transporter permease [Bacillota bacterium]|nr:ABC transporter permease [Bacillota bacterium]